MTIVLELPPDQERRLQDTAAAQGLTVGQLVVELLEKAPQSGAASPVPLRNRSILEFEGVSAGRQGNQDAQDYINETRHEWDRQP